MPHLLDTTGLCCPIPVLLTLRELRHLDPGERLAVVGDDPAMAEDIPAFCDLHSHRILEREEEGESLSFVIEKAQGE